MKRLAPCIVAALLLCATGAAASPALDLHEATQSAPHPNAVAALVDTRTWLGLQLHALRQIALGARDQRMIAAAALEVPLLLWGSGGGVDSGRLGVRGAWIYEGVRPYRLGLDLATRIATNRDVMGTLVAWDMNLVALAGVRLGPGSLSVSVGFQQGLASHVRHSRYARAAFDDRYPPGTDGGVDGPRNGWIALPFRRFSFGLSGGCDVGERMALVAGGGLVQTPTEYEAGPVDTMMFGVWPFYAELGLVVRF